MNRISQNAMRAWMNLGTRYLPFADAATPDLPLSRLLRLSLFQVSVGMALVLLVGTLNRVMIVELAVPASLVGIMISLPVLAAPFRALVGFRSDRHKSVLGWRRVPFIYRGALLQFGGLSIMPFALLVLSGQGHAADAPAWIGMATAALAFLLVGIGVHVVQTVGLALATDLAPVEDRPKVVGLMYVMMLVGMFASALVFGWLLSDFSNGRLVQVIQASAVLTLVLNGIAMWKQEPRGGARRAAIAAAAEETEFASAWRRFARADGALRHLVVISLGTMAFSMQDVLLEPYGGQVLGLAIAETTRLTATLALGGVAGFALASRVIGGGYDPMRLALVGAALGIPAFAAVILSNPLDSVMLFVLGTSLIGFGAGLFGHGTLTATMNRAPAGEAGLALGAWGAAQASAAGVGVALGGVVRDLVAGGGAAPASGYHVVYGIEIALLCVCLLLALPAQRLRVPHRPQPFA
jgi:BCD family chlorophyll transporter-like MFS transporter